MSYVEHLVSYPVRYRYSLTKHWILRKGHLLVTLLIMETITLLVWNWLLGRRLPRHFILYELFSSNYIKNVTSHSIIRLKLTQNWYIIRTKYSYNFLNNVIIGTPILRVKTYFKHERILTQNDFFFCTYHAKHLRSLQILKLIFFLPVSDMRN